MPPSTNSSIVKNPLLKSSNMNQANNSMGKKVFNKRRVPFGGVGSLQ